MSWFTKHFVDPIVAPVRVFAKMDPVGQAISGNDVSFNPDKNLNAGLHTTYQNDPIAQDVGIREDDAVKAGKVAAAAVATYFTAGLASGLFAGAADAGAGAAAADAGAGAGWVSAEGGASYAGGMAADAATTAVVDTAVSGASDLSLANGMPAESALPAASTPSGITAGSLIKDTTAVLGLANTATNLLNKSSNKQMLPTASSPFRTVPNSSTSPSSNLTAPPGATYGDPSAVNNTQELSKQNVAPNSPLTKSLPPTIAGMPTKTVIAVAVLAGALYLAYKYGGKDIAKVVS